MPPEIDSLTLDAAPLPTPPPALPTESEQAAAPAKSATSAAARPNSVINLAWNWGGVAAEALVGLILTPFLVHSLGDETYGIWILIGAMTGCFGVLDFGLRGAVGRFVAFHHARNDRAAIERVLSTAAVTLCGVALVALAGMCITAWALPWLFEIPAELVSAARWATVIVGLQLAAFFVLRLFDAALFAYQRFDILNLIDIPTIVLRAALLWWLVSAGYGLMGLAWVSLLAVVLSGLVKGWCMFRITPGMRIWPSLADRDVRRELLGYGLWNFIISAAAIARSQLSPLLIGLLIGVRAVGPFSIIMRLSTMAMTILASATSVLSPVAVAAHALDDEAGRKQLLIVGTRLSCCLALYFLTLYVCLGKPLLSLWIRADFIEHWPNLVALGCGEVLPMSMSVGNGIILAMARHRRLAALAILETVLSIGVSALVAPFFGLLGFVIVLAATATLFRGVFVLFHVCRLVAISPWEFVWRTLVGPALCSLAPFLALFLLVSVHHPGNWRELFVYTGLISVLTALVVAGGVVGWAQTLAVKAQLSSRFFAADGKSCSPQ